MEASALGLPAGRQRLVAIMPRVGHIAGRKGVGAGPRHQPPLHAAVQAVMIPRAHVHIAESRHGAAFIPETVRPSAGRAERPCNGHRTARLPKAVCPVPVVRHVNRPPVGAADDHLVHNRAGPALRHPELVVRAACPDLPLDGGDNAVIGNYTFL